MRDRKREEEERKARIMGAVERFAARGDNGKCPLCGFSPYVPGASVHPFGGVHKRKSETAWCNGKARIMSAVERENGRKPDLEEGD